MKAIGTPKHRVVAATLFGVALVAADWAIVAAKVQRPQVVSSRIVNGKLTSDFPTTGGLLYSESGAFIETNGPTASWIDAPMVCTGTLIGCSTFLTAGHCVDDDDDPTH